MEPQKNNRQIEINDLIDDAITNAVVRRGLLVADANLAVSDEEAAMIAGGTGVIESARIADGVKKPDITIAGFKPVNPPICPPTKPPVKPIKPPIIVGLIALPENDKTA